MTSFLPQAKKNKTKQNKTKRQKLIDNKEYFEEENFYRYMTIFRIFH